MMMREVRTERCYRSLMEEGTPFIELRISLEQPPELFALISAFTAIGNQFDRYIRDHHEALHGDARLFVKEIRQGSIVVDLIPVILPLIENMDRVLIVDDFVRKYGGLLLTYARWADPAGLPVPKQDKSAVQDFLGQVGVIATDPNATATISSAIYHETKTTKRVEISFGTPEARQAKQILQRRIVEIDLPAYESHERVFMRFYQSNLADPSVGTGERGVIIGDVDSRPLALIYETDRAKDRIKHETSVSEGNVYRKGFIVDCYVQKTEVAAGAKPVAYRVTDVHEVFDLPDDLIQPSTP